MGLFGPSRTINPIRVSPSPRISAPTLPNFVNPAPTNLPKHRLVESADAPIEGYKTGMLFRTGDPVKDAGFSNSGINPNDNYDTLVNESFEALGGNAELPARFISNQDSTVHIPAPYVPTTGIDITDGNGSPILDQNGQPIFS